jgi:hypothetical protein
MKELDNLRRELTQLRQQLGVLESRARRAWVYPTGGGGSSAFDGEYLKLTGTPYAVGTIIQPASDVVIPASSNLTEADARVLGMVVSTEGGVTTLQMSGFVHHDLSSAPWWGSLTGGRAYLTSSGGLSHTKPTEPAFVVPVADVVADIDGAKRLFILGGAATASDLSRPYPLALKWGGTGLDMTVATPNSMVIMAASGNNLATNTNASARPGIPWQKQAGQIQWAVAPTIDTSDPFAAVLVIYRPVTDAIEYGSLGDILPPATVNQQVLMWDETEEIWYAQSLMDSTGELLSHDGTELTTIDASTPRSVLGNPTDSAAVPEAIAATDNNQILVSTTDSLEWLAAPSTSGQVLTFTSGALAWATPAAGLPAVTTSNAGSALNVSTGGAWQVTRSVLLGKDELTASSIQGLLGVVKSNDGDYIKLSSAGLEIFDRSVSTGTALIRLDIGHASLNATGRALSVREIDVCDAGVAKKMLILASAPY